jgi:putative ABC transport system permease protein
MALSPDVRGALRGLRRSPAFVFLAALTLGLGAGATGATFALVDRVVLEPLPITDEASVVVAWGNHRARDFPHFPFSYEAWTRLAEGAQGVERIAAVDVWGSSERLIEDPDGLALVRWSRVLGDFFGIMDITPVIGRTLDSTDDVRGGPRNVVVSYGLWQRRWGGDPSVAGATLRIDGQTHTVVGVVPRDFDFPRGTDVWAPTLAQYPGSAEPPRLELDVIARLEAGAATGQLSAEIERLVVREPSLESAYGDVEPIVQPFRDVLLGDMRPVVLLLFAGTVLLLVVAIVNAGNLVLVRSGDRSAAWAIRHALGAGRRQLTLAPVVESGVITGLAAVIALFTTQASLAALLPLAPESLRGMDYITPGTTTWVLLSAILLLSGSLLTLLPVARAPGPRDARGVLRSGSRVEPRRRLGRTFVVSGQAALALWSVVTAALLVRSLGNLQALETGFDQNDLHVVQIDHDHVNFAIPQDWPDRARSAMERIEREPGIVAVTPVLSQPLIGNGGFDLVPTLVGDPPAGPLPYLNFELTLPGYFETLGLRVVRGRATDETDVRSTLPAVVINEEAAGTLWPGEDALGRQLVLPFPGYEETVWTVVGIAADARYRSYLTIRPSLYVPLRQMPIIAPRWIVVRTDRAIDLARAVGVAFGEADPGTRVVGVTSVPERMALPLARPRFALAVLSVIAGIILVLAAVGAYGVMAAGVRGRQRELGVRMACGAAPADVGRLILREGLLLATTGIIVGGLASVATGRWVEWLLFGVRATDPLVLAAAAAVVLATAVAACTSPALRAARTDPLTVLRADE